MTVTGNPAEFTVNGVAATVNSLTVPFSPIHDLNGYSHPWPAGGGKNLLDKSKAKLYNDVARFIKFGVSAYSDTTPNGDLYLEAGTYTFSVSGDGTANFSAFNVYNSSGTSIKVQYNRKVSTFTVSENGAYIITLDMGDSVDWSIYNVQLELGSTATSWEPYENICPISGRTGLSVYVSPTQDQQDATTYAVDWTSQAGTVYGGTVDVVTGVLTVDMAMVDLGTRTWGYISPTSNIPYGAFYANVSGKAKKENDVVCSSYPLSTNYFRVDKSVLGNSASNTVYVVDSSYTDTTTFTSAMSGVQLVYELATPLTYQLTPQTINLLAGIMNYVWSDTDEDITISFDVAAFIRQLFRVNGVDFSRFVERDSYATALEPVYAETIQTMDGVNHTALLRTRGSIRLRFNPQTDSDTAALCSALLAAPCEVQYRCLQRDVDVTALMCVDTISAQFLSRCLYLGDEWNQIESITLTEL
jgi:hypothetical protein